MKNPYEIIEEQGIALIHCKRYNKVVKAPISIEDLARAKEYPNTWSLQWNAKSRTYYVRGQLNGKKVFLHAWLMNPDSGKVVDHINHIGTDNRRNNLKVCSNTENGRNILSEVIFDQWLGLHGALMKNSKDKYGNLYWGVSHFKDIFLGRFKDEAEAFLIQWIAQEVYDRITDEQILNRIVPRGHKAEDVQRRIDFVRKTFKMPDPARAVLT
ncbi:HNH endonuclease [Neobacillus pocheonensis]|uniref:HNH endonuclease n=1 Tax=Neobacillus pocheonensis TaxID=363869 RepID=UPI003D2C095A